MLVLIAMVMFYHSDILDIIDKRDMQTFFPAKFGAIVTGKTRIF